MKNVLLATIASSFFMFSCTEDLENGLMKFQLKDIRQSVVVEDKTINL